ncbi:hypothetical protein SH528x_001932 [Novipirellula sp. SH528]|uniref:hypothetical protein n=1 Tax=Novipirellula sp. SH528 TaxID=3454466 RepID=UPI003F9EC2CC
MFCDRSNSSFKQSTKVEQPNIDFDAPPDCLNSRLPECSHPWTQWKPFVVYDFTPMLM